MNLAKYLGVHAADLLTSKPFSGWSARRTVNHALPKKRVFYEFDSQGVDVICDEDDTIQTIFLRARVVGESLSDIPFALGRKDVLDRLGSPSKSGPPRRDSVLGKSGAWDRFSLGTQGMIHVQYCVDSDEIYMITLMRPDAVP